jgi:hypothetical protein
MSKPDNCSQCIGIGNIVYWMIKPNELYVRLHTEVKDAPWEGVTLTPRQILDLIRLGCQITNC